MTRYELRRRVSNAIALQLVGDFKEVDIADQIEAATSAVLAVIASLEDERVAVVADIQSAKIDNIDLDPVFSYKRGYHDATLDAIKALRRHGEGLTIAPTAYAALRKIVDCANRLNRCVDEFPGIDIDACAEFQQELDAAILEGKTLISELP